MEETQPLEPSNAGQDPPDIRFQPGPRPKKFKNMDAAKAWIEKYKRGEVSADDPAEGEITTPAEPTSAPPTADKPPAAAGESNRKGPQMDTEERLDRLERELGKAKSLWFVRSRVIIAVATLAVVVALLVPPWGEDQAAIRRGEYYDQQPAHS